MLIPLHFDMCMCVTVCVCVKTNSTHKVSWGKITTDLNPHCKGFMGGGVVFVSREVMNQTEEGCSPVTDYFSSK